MNERFLVIKKLTTVSILYDTDTSTCPYILVENKLIRRYGLPETTRDLMEYQVRLFSSKELLEKFINCKGENEDELWNRPGI